MSEHKAILVTGASTGIGRDIIEKLSSDGYIVYGTVRNEADFQELGKINNVIPLMVDVRNNEDVKQARKIIEEKGYGLFGVVNNAGIGGIGPFSTWTDEELLDIFNVNVFGVHRITNAFIDLIVESKGRIVNIGSQGGMTTSKYFGPYTMTKHALEAYTTSLNEEMQPYGVWVSVIQPGGIVSEIGENSMPNLISRLERANQSFKKEADAILASIKQPPPPKDGVEPESATNRLPSHPKIVTEAVKDALFSDKPKMRYLVGTKWEGDRVIHGLIDRLLDENDNPQHNYSKEELSSKLDEAIKKRASL
jgi:short-subunit dehydrogenase